MPIMPIESQYPNFDSLSSIDQIATLAGGIVGYAREIIRGMELARTIAGANDIAAIIAAAAPGTGVDGSTMLSKERAASILLMQAWFLTEIDTPLGDSGLTPRMILYRKWPAPTQPEA